MLKFVCDFDLFVEEVGERWTLSNLDASPTLCEKIHLFGGGLLTVQCRQWNYDDQRRRSLEFVVDDFVFLKVSPKKGIIRFGKKGK